MWKPRAAPLGPSRMGIGPKVRPGSCSPGSVLPTDPLACSWQGSRLCPQSAPCFWACSGRHVIDAQLIATPSHLLAKKETCGMAGISDCSSGSDTAHSPWSRSLRTCYLWVRRTPRRPGVCTPRDTSKSAWPPHGCYSTAHSLHSHSHRLAGHSCLRTEGDGPRRASAGQGEPASWPPLPGPGPLFCIRVALSCQLQRLGLAPPCSAD